MKKNIISMTYLLSLSFFLCALQGSLFFLPIPLPFFWFIILTFYSFRKGLIFSLTTNFFHALIIISFSVISLSRLLIMMNLLTLLFFVVKDRFHTSHWHITLAASAGTLLFLSTNWLADALTQNFFLPPLLSWIGAALATLIAAPPLIFIFDKIEQRIQFERVDTLENLRI